MGEEVRHAMFASDADSDIRIIVLTGAGRGFCAGADMEGLAQAAQSGPEELHRALSPESAPASRTDVRRDFDSRYSYFPSIGKPVIAAVNGPAVGLGFILTLYCDLRFATSEARFGTAFARRGLIAEFGTAWLLPRLIGPARALDLLLSARMIDAAEAEKIGLVSGILTMEKIQEYANMLASTVSPRSMRVIKKQVYEGMFQTLEEAIDLAGREMETSLSTADFREGVAHFLEKRAPRFTDE